MRVLLCGGGTAGHVMPAIAIAEIIEKSFEDTEIAFAGRDGGSENAAYENTGHRLYTVDISGLKRSFDINNIKSVIKILKSGRNARVILKEFKPDLIIGTGGYVCYPFIKQGKRLGIRTLLHESNVAPGLVTRMLGPRCDKVLLNLEGTRDHLRRSGNTVVVGNPTRKDFTILTKAEAKRRLSIPENKALIVSFGGSLGAEALNKSVLDLIERHTAHLSVYHVHATGRKHYDGIKNERQQLFSTRKNVKIVPYIENMPTVMRAADIAITRSGAITISELCKCATPSILIPSPNVTANHQYVNAEYMQSKGAAVLIEEKDLTSERLYSELSAIMNDKAKMQKMSENARKLSSKDTDGLIVKAIKDAMRV